MADPVLVRNRDLDFAAALGRADAGPLTLQAGDLPLERRDHGRSFTRARNHEELGAPVLFLPLADLDSRLRALEDGEMCVASPRRRAVVPEHVQLHVYA